MPRLEICVQRGQLLYLHGCFSSCAMGRRAPGANPEVRRACRAHDVATSAIEISQGVRMQLAAIALVPVVHDVGHILSDGSARGRGALHKQPCEYYAGASCSIALGT